MSRGLGQSQRFLLVCIRRSRKPITFAEICTIILQELGVNDPDRKLKPTFERSLRRSLKRMVDDAILMALGRGGPGDPQRYCTNPLMHALGGDEEEFERVSAMVKADPGAAVASLETMQHMWKT